MAIAFDPDEVGRQYGDPPPAEVRALRPPPATLATSTWGDLEALAQTAPPAQIVEGLIAEGERVLVYGFSGVGKSVFCRELALAVHRGLAFLGRIPTLCRRAGIIDEESPASRLGEHLVRMARAHSLDPRTDDLPVFAVRQGARLDTAEGIDAIAAWIRRNELAVLAIDTLIRTHRLRENDAEDMARIDQATRALQDETAWPLTIILAHHAPKPRENSANDAATMARGSSDLFGSADVGLYLRRGREPGQLVVEHTKARWSEPLPPFLARLETSAESVRMVHAGGLEDLAGLLDRAREVVLVALREGPRSRPELLERGRAAKVSTRTIDMALKRIVDDQAAVKSKSGKTAIYALTEGGLLTA